MLKIFRFLLLSLLFLAALSGEASADEPEIDVLHVEGVINPVIADYIDRGIDQAEQNNAVACVIELDTPGGLYSSTRDIVARFQDSRVPVVVWVEWAGSAGAFITVGSHVAAMQPGSNIGAAHPVFADEVSEAQEEKAVEDAAAWMRELARLRGRSAEYAELMVRESKSYSVEEAINNNLVDLEAGSLEELCSKLDGRKVTLDNGEEVTLETRDCVINHIGMNALERFLHTISDPNIAYILLSVAMLGIFFELANPGAIIPGVVGGISLLLALYSLGTLDAYWGGMLLIILAFGLFVAEFFTPTFGLLTAGGIASLTIGSLILFSGRSPLFQVDRWLIAVVVVLVTGFFVFVVGAVVRAHRRKLTSGQQAMVGKTAVAQSALDPIGTVLIEGERWTATVEGGTIEPGEEVIVTKVEGLKLKVSKRKSG